MQLAAKVFKYESRIKALQFMKTDMKAQYTYYCTQNLGCLSSVCQNSVSNVWQAFVHSDSTVLYLAMESVAMVRCFILLHYFRKSGCFCTNVEPSLKNKKTKNKSFRFIQKLTQKLFTYIFPSLTHTVVQKHLSHLPFIFIWQHIFQGIKSIYENMNVTLQEKKKTSVCKSFKLLQKCTAQVWPDYPDSEIKSGSGQILSRP